LAGLFVGQIAAFEAWERGSRAGAPLILTLAGSDGSPPVSLQAYEITDDRLRMTGTAARGEAVRLDLRIDQGALATARRNLGDQTPVMSGAVQVGDRRFPVRAASQAAPAIVSQMKAPTAPAKMIDPRRRPGSAARRSCAGRGGPDFISGSRDTLQPKIDFQIGSRPDRRRRAAAEPWTRASDPKADRLS
jgi:hypothetical protein